MKKIIFTLTILLSLLFLFGCTQTGVYSNSSDSEVSELSILSQQLEIVGDNINFYFVIETDNNQFLNKLQKGNFEIIYNDKPIPFNIELSNNQTKKTVLVIDRSNSMIWDKYRRTLPVDKQPLTFAKETAKRFVSKIKQQDEVAVVAFSQYSLVMSGFSNSKETLNHKINLIAAGPSTAIYDGLYQALLLSGGEKGRKAIIAMTDGANNSGEFNKTDIINLSEKFRIPIFTIGYSTMGETEYDEDILKEISQKTGGKFYKSSDEDILDDVYNNISDLLSNQYYINFSLPVDSNLENIKLIVNYENANGKIIEEIFIK